MSLTPQEIAELDSLLSELADDRLDSRGLAALEALLKSQPEACDHYIRFMALCSDLHDAAATALSAEESESGSERTTALQKASGDVSAGRAERQVHVPGRWWPGWVISGAIAIVLAALAGVTWWLAFQGADSTVPSAARIGRLEELDGEVAVQGRNLHGPSAVGHELRCGDHIATRGPDAHVVVRLRDGSRLALSGDTRLVIAEDDAGRVEVWHGNLVASVRPRPAARPLVICTPEANVQVLGTRLSISCEPRKTHVAVLEGEIRVTRLSDDREVQLTPGQAAEVSSETDLQAMPLSAVPDHWSLDFNDGLPEGWQTGQLVFDDLPAGSEAAVRTVGMTQHGRLRYQIRSHNAWSDGLFALHDDSWMHIRYRVEKPGTFLFYVVCRQHDFGQPVATLLMPDNLRQREGGKWHTLTLAMNQLYRTKTQDRIPLAGQLVAFLLVFDSPEHNPGLTIDRIWVTRGGIAEPRSPTDTHPARADEMID